jgi:O-antigen biosynthesis protein
LSGDCKSLEVVRPIDPASDYTSCAVVVCTRDRAELLVRCLEGIAAQSQSPSEIIVINNGKTDGSIQEIAARFGATYAVEPVAGLSQARNRGLKLSNSELIAFVDDDAVPDRDWLKHLTREFQEPSVGFATCRITDRLTDGHGDVINFTRGDDRRIALHRESPGWFTSVNFGWIGDGTGFVVRKRALKDAGGFCVELGRGTLLDGSEEHHAFSNIIRAGFVGLYVPDAILNHLPSTNTPEKATGRILKDTSNLFAYITKLLVEEPSWRMELLRYLFRKRDQNRRPLQLRNLKKTVPRWRLWLAMLSGPIVYLRSRRSRRVTPPEPSESANPERAAMEKDKRKTLPVRST